MKQPVSTFIIVRFNKLEFYEEIKISVDKYTVLNLGVGGDYKYETGIIHRVYDLILYRSLILVMLELILLVILKHMVFQHV